MARRVGWLGPALVLLLGAGYQYLVHSALAGEQTELVRMSLAFLPLLALAWWVVASAHNKLRWSLVLLAAGAGMYVLEQRASWGIAAAYGIPHAAVYLSLLWLFGHTLWQGKEPLVTRLARRVHGTLSPELAAYTRRVTWAWCVFFGAQIAVSVLFFRFAPLSVWSLFINALNIPLVALMFIGEYGYRMVCHRDFPHASLVDGVRAFTKDAAHSASTHKCMGART